MEIRKVVVVVEEAHKEAGREVSPPTRKAAAIAVIKNPFAGRYEEDLSLLMEYGEKLGGMLGERAVAALGIPKERVDSYGKGAIVGLGGELEHAAAILHPKLGAPLREAVGGGRPSRRRDPGGHRGHRLGQAAGQGWGPEEGGGEGRGRPQIRAFRGQSP